MHSLPLAFILTALSLVTSSAEASQYKHLRRQQHASNNRRDTSTSGWTLNNGTSFDASLADEATGLQEEEELHLWKRSMGPSWKSKPTLRQNKVSAGVSAMQLTVVGRNTILVIDKSENNPLQITGNTPVDNGKTHPAWIQWLNYETGKGHAMQAQTNTFCAGGSWLSNGSFVSIGGNPAVNKASYYDENGITGIRVFDRCDENECTIYENPQTLRLSSARWYPGTVRLQDGSVFIAGGMTQGGFNNVKSTDNPSFEYYPPKSINNGMPLYSKFLHDSLNSNLFPIIHLLPGGNLFIAANTRAMIYNWQKNKEQRIADLPHGVRITYPFSAASALLPLTIANKWTPTAWFCGGSTVNDNTPAYKMSAETSASNQCASIQLDKNGLKKGWQVEKMKTPRIMGDAILTPDGKVVVVNGARTGVADGNVHNVIGQSNADNPDYQGFIYDPLQAKGKRFSYNMPTSKIARMYHSVASLTPTGDIVIAGSNPNADVSTAVYQTEYRIEVLSPPYQRQTKPTFTWCPANIQFGRSFKIIMEKFPTNTKLSDISIVLMDMGYHTHAVGVDQRMVELNIMSWDKSNNQVLIKSPMNGTYMPAGRAWLFLVIKGIPSEGCMVIVGDGSDPPFDHAAYKNMMSKTAHSHGKPVY